MIGRMKPILNVLSAAEHDVYRAHYCGVCAAAKQTYGRRSSLGHSSEMVFVSLLFEGLDPESFHRGRAGCTALPIVPRKLAVGDARHNRALAAGVLATLQLDLADAREDRERWIKQLLCRPHRTMAGAIDPGSARDEEFVAEAVADLPADDTARVVAGVIGSVFQLAEFEPAIVRIGCRIGFMLGRLMNLSDAVEDYFRDRKAEKSNALDHYPQPLDPADVEFDLYDVIDRLAALVDLLPLKKHAELIGSLVNVHARARAAGGMEKLRKGLAAADHSDAAAVGSRSRS